ncbi:hypothetical protein [Magnetospirillum gryphiswaldense]|uniref:hypothetical protein n=1 Tax=Magnetospirillum gryphiswaldense TaxID=55518 RepID=UPI001182E91E|nr:hypothetical protein [Magnetospirillum gryphiswaldense]
MAEIRQNPSDPAGGVFPLSGNNLAAAPNSGPGGQFGSFLPLCGKLIGIGGPYFFRGMTDGGMVSALP